MGHYSSRRHSSFDFRCAKKNAINNSGMRRQNSLLKCPCSVFASNALCFSII
nr:unnamed protein product [Callosobruchus chinensis]